MATIELRVPDIGNFDAVDIIEIPVKVGDTVAVDDTLMTLESDKASMDVPAEAAGKIVELLVKVGDQVTTGDLIGRMEVAGDAEADSVKSDTAQAPAETSKTEAAKTESVQAPVAKVAAQPAGEIAEIRIPAVGNNDELDVIDIPVKVGDVVALDDTLATLESDKASMDVPADKAGTITEIALSVGDKVKEGDLVVKIATGGSSSESTSTSVAAQAPEAKSSDVKVTSASKPDLTAPHKGDEIPVAPPSQVAQATLDISGAHASPSVRAFARELGANLNEVKGSGRNGRIVREDVLSYVKGVLSGTQPAVAGKATVSSNGGGLDLLPWPKVDFTKFGEVEEKPLSRIQKISGANLARNWAMIPHVAQFDEADITDLEALRKQLNKEYEKQGARVTILAFLFKAVVKALQKFPEFNSSLEGDKLILKKYYHIGFAADTPNGLVVPVIRDCDKKGVLEIAAEMRELAGLARDGKLKPDQMTGGCFTISSLGGIGGTNFIPIINAPEVAILGVAKNQIKPVWNGKEFEPRLMIPLSLSYDHRVIDGALGARFIVYLNELLTDMRRMVI
ncbi:dihydrolipoyllysine-residue acetyltransferase [Ignatzschineria ureiclastica]|uniref:Acetyltransferase component of pyruvate dehydrogenase complex n=1 Tax=Ignatzschineria ureiclastica TaxID=472582 RepID=A0A2U2AH48_9GAMM|nr:dihydrolipoyllysine-residue acetyltransferase [Ignatzschineria ureiclastica]PWD81978.1 dihydrolipoyllysine-residue acetyltransferase [Ignatzschineria ureiclastica]GGZ91800.1 acetyltransferase component of pyruvate dehydrogenase complex [Ignatzschineria ureiclastica]